VRLSQPVHSDSFRIRFLDARVSISFGNLSMYYLEDIQEEKVLTIARTSLNGKAISLSFNGIRGGADSNLLIDGNDKTTWKGLVDELPATIVMRLKNPQTLTGISYLPDGTSNNHIDNYAIYTSSDGSNWELASSGRFGNIENNPVEQFINFAATDVQYVKLEIQKIVSSQKRVNINEIKLFVK
jgi:alpha-L-fucosidase